MAMGKTLGLDLGPNSIGWALIDDTPKATEPIIGIGVRVFAEGVANFDSGREVSRSESRRIARGMRRQNARRNLRRIRLIEALITAGLWPESEEQQSELLTLDPYELRSRALEQKLEPFELGRILLHLSKRRGFQSNAKQDRDDKEAQGMLAEINENQQEVDASGKETLGAWLHDKQSDLDHTSRKENDHVRNRHLARRQYLDEFETIWTRQQSLGHQDLLTDTLKFGSQGESRYPCKPKPRTQSEPLLEKYGIHGLIFFQRKMYWPTSVIGTCKYETKQKRCPRADRRAQRFRLLQEINNLRFIDPDTNREEKLTDDERTLLTERLSAKESMTFDQIRKALGFLESIRFNLEKGQRPRLQGMIVDTRLAKVCGKLWKGLSEDEKNEIVASLADPNLDEFELQDALTRHEKIENELAEKLMGVDLPTGYLHLSLKAIKKLLPFMEQGMLLSAPDEQNSALHVAGYLRPDQLKKRLFGKLPIPGRAHDSPIGDIPNPVVKRTLVELRKVVNAIIKEFGRPDAVHIEMGRDLKTRPKPGTKGFKRYQEQISEQRSREAARSEAADRLRENKQRVTRDNIIKYLLWVEQGHQCAYSGKPITVKQLFGEASGVEVDHILPYSRSLDDSQMNKVVCFRQTKDSLGNHDKGNKTPYEWLAESRAEDYDAVCQRARRFAYPKYRRFLQKDVNVDDFIERQLNDMRYISKATCEYMKCLFEKDHAILGLKGQLTAELRNQWGLNTIIQELPDSPAWQEAAKMRAGEKNRADHRHHAVDALVIALTDRKRLIKLSEIAKEGGSDAVGKSIPEPWQKFRDSVSEAIADINVSHRVERGVSGKLHEETFYGPTEKSNTYVVRKKLAELSPSEIEKIRDASIRDLVIQTLQSQGIEFGRGKAKFNKQAQAVLENVKMKSGVPVNKVRITVNSETMVRLGEDKFVKPGSTHHVTLFRWVDNDQVKQAPEFTTLLEAARRVANKETIIRRTPDPKNLTIPADAEFVMSLSGRELVLWSKNSQERLMVYRTSAQSSGQLILCEHTDARRAPPTKGNTAYASGFEARKVTVDPIGRLRWAND